MHRPPNWTRLDVAHLERANDVGRSYTMNVGIEMDDAQPAGVHSPRCFRLKCDAGDVGQRFAISFGDSLTLPNPLVEHLELPATNPREHIAHPIVVTELGVLVFDFRFFGLCRPLLEHRGGRGVFAHAHSKEAKIEYE